MNLTPYQVGENDIVLAPCENSAIDLLADYCGFDADEMSSDDVTNLSKRLDMKLQDEEGNDIGTLGSYVEGMNEAQYIVGWE